LAPFHAVSKRKPALFCVNISPRGERLSQPTKGSLEAEIAAAVVRFQREQQGRGAAEVRAHILGDLVLVRCTGIFTQTEARLSSSDEGRKLIKSSRQELRSINHEEIEAIVSEILGCTVVRSFYDVDTTAAEQVEIYVLIEDVEKRLPRAR
jgi:uncharacterized protein YbcI